MIKRPTLLKQIIYGLFSSFLLIYIIFLYFSIYLFAIGKSFKGLTGSDRNLYLLLLSLLILVIFLLLIILYDIIKKFNRGIWISVPSTSNYLNCLKEIVPNFKKVKGHVITIPIEDSYIYKDIHLDIYNNSENETLLHIYSNKKSRSKQLLKIKYKLLNILKKE